MKQQIWKDGLYCIKSWNVVTKYKWYFEMYLKLRQYPTLYTINYVFNLNIIGIIAVFK